MGRDFADALAVVLREEGGFVNDTRDPGGMTNLGVTATTWRAWLGRPVTEATMRALTVQAVSPMYRAWYWDKVGGNTIPLPLALMAFDFAVNAGPAAALRALQGVIGAQVDGQFGQGTQRAVQSYVTGIGLGKLIGRFAEARRDHYRTLSTFPVFGKGWLGRIGRVEQEAMSWLA